MGKDLKYGITLLFALTGASYAAIYGVNENNNMEKKDIINTILGFGGFLILCVIFFYFYYESITDESEN